MRNRVDSDRAPHGRWYWPAIPVKRGVIAMTVHNSVSTLVSLRERIRFPDEGVAPLLVKIDDPHYGINRGLQNAGFDRKREVLFAESNLQLNRQLMILKEWNEDAIDRRGRDLFDAARRIWPGPD